MSNAKARLAAYDKLYKENKDKLHMPKKRNYPINYRTGMKWANKHCDAESVKFASEIIAHTI